MGGTAPAVGVEAFRSEATITEHATGLCSSGAQLMCLWEIKIVAKNTYRYPKFISVTVIREATLR
jgi:hypothetical protein